MNLVKHFERSLLLEMVIFILKCLCVKYVLCASAKLCTVVEAPGAQGTPMVTTELSLSFGDPETIGDEILWMTELRVCLVEQLGGEEVSQHLSKSITSRRNPH